MRPFQLLFRHSCFDIVYTLSTSVILWLQTPDFAGANNNKPRSSLALLLEVV
jgi:hypothetical protein